MNEEALKRLFYVARNLAWFAEDAEAGLIDAARWDLLWAEEWMRLAEKVL